MEERKEDKKGWWFSLPALVLMGLVPSCLIWLGFRAAGAKNPAWHWLVFAALFSAGLWGLLGRAAGYPKSRGFGCLAFLVWLSILSLVAAFGSGLFKKPRVHFFTPLGKEDQGFVRANLPRFSNLRLDLDGDTRPCLALPPNHSMARDFMIPARGVPVLVFGLGVDRPETVSGKFLLQVMARPENGPSVKLKEVELDQKRAEWRDYQVPLPETWTGKRVKLIFQLRSRGKLKQEPDPAALVFISSPRVVAAGERPHILLLVLDTLRADHVSLSPEGPTPNLARIAEKGYWFANHYAQSSWTTPSTASLLTSTMPAQTGAVSAERLYLSSENHTLAEALAAGGYLTAAISGNLVISPYFNFDQGFDSFRLSLSFPFYCLDSGGKLTEEAIGWLETHKSLPFFLYLHYIDPHDPYLPPLEFVEFGSGEDEIPFIDFMKTLAFWGPIRIRKGKSVPREELAPAYHYLHRGEIKYLDRELGRLFDSLSRLGILDSTIIIITSDHGEEWLEHGLMVHGHSLYEELLRVPLIIFDGRNPRPGPVIVETRTSNLDLAPTILELAGFQPEPEMLGKSLAPLMERKAPARPETVFAELPIPGNYHLFHPAQARGYKGKYLRAMVYGTMKIIKVIDPETGAANFEIYDLTKDPEEKRNLATTGLRGFQKELDEMDKFFESLPGEVKPSEVTKMPPRMREKLKALGYIK